MSDPITAEQRGTEWVAEHGCTTWCVTDHVVEGDPGWHQGPAAELLSPAPFCSQTPGEPILPLLTARVNTTNQDADIFGIETRLWIDVGVDTLELTVTETDQLIAGLEQTLPKLRALRTQLAVASKGDTPRDKAAIAKWRATPLAPKAATKAGL